MGVYYEFAYDAPPPNGATNSASIDVALRLSAPLRYFFAKPCVRAVRMTREEFANDAWYCDTEVPEAKGCKYASEKRRSPTGSARLGKLGS